MQDHSHLSPPHDNDVICLHHSNRYRLFILYSFVSSKQNSFSYVASLKLTGISVHIISTTALFAFFLRRQTKGGGAKGELSAHKKMGVKTTAPARMPLFSVSPPDLHITCCDSTTQRTVNQGYQRESSSVS